MKPNRPKPPRPNKLARELNSINEYTPQKKRAQYKYHRWTDSLALGGAKDKEGNLKNQNYRLREPLTGKLKFEMEAIERNRQRVSLKRDQRKLERDLMEVWD